MGQSSTVGSSRLVSVGLPIRNGADTLPDVVKSVLAQDYDNFELVISDNASTDDTEDVARELARSDERIRYHRQATGVKIQENFSTAMRLARGEFFRWIGDDDSLDPTYLSRCTEVLASDDRLVLVSTGIRYELDDGSISDTPYLRSGLRSDDPAVRFAEWTWLLTQSFELLDPMYSLVRRAKVVDIPRLERMREDELFAAKVALLGPWAHIAEPLATRRWPAQTQPNLARKLGAPLWTAYVSGEIECFRFWQLVGESGLTPEQRRRARRAIARLEVVRVGQRAKRVAGRVTAKVTGAAKS